MKESFPHKNMDGNSPIVYRPSLLSVGLLVASCVVIFLFYSSELAQMEIWWRRDEYSYGYMLPLITAFLIWQKKSDLEQTPYRNGWLGVLLVMLGLLLYTIGGMGHSITVRQYTFIILLSGLFISFVGWSAFKVIWVPVFLMVFMVPLPEYLFNILSDLLITIAAQMGTDFIRLFGVNVVLTNNLIDLGVHKLVVVEACSGMRYLFPLMILGFIAAYVFHGAFWKKALIFLSCIPITIGMNSMRIGAIGVMVNYWGGSMAEGFLHNFEGWAIFMACIVILLLLMWLLSQVGQDKKPFQDAFSLDIPEPTPDDAIIRRQGPAIPLLVSFLMILSGYMAFSVLQFDKREANIMATVSLQSFPLKIGEWEGTYEVLDRDFVASLGVDGYVLIDYLLPDNESKITLYIGHYASQAGHNIDHSHRIFLPGNKWKTSKVEQLHLEGVELNTHALQVNRLIHSLSNARQLVYYWFQGRDHITTSEIATEWGLFRDALIFNRSDGVTIKLVTYLQPDDNVNEAELRLDDFIRAAKSYLEVYM